MIALNSYNYPNVRGREISRKLIFRFRQSNIEIFVARRSIEVIVLWEQEQFTRIHVESFLRFSAVSRCHSSLDQSFARR